MLWERMRMVPRLLPASRAIFCTTDHRHLNLSHRGRTPEAGVECHGRGACRPSAEGSAGAVLVPDWSGEVRAVSNWIRPRSAPPVTNLTDEKLLETADGERGRLVFHCSQRGSHVIYRKAPLMCFLTDVVLVPSHSSAHNGRGHLG
jgi:hypothetical protein